jgi:hypothetical protein
MRRAIRLISIVLLGVLGLLPAPLWAAPVGNVDLGFSSLGLTSTGIDFAPLGGGSGSFDVGPSATGVFAGLTGTLGNSKDLLSQPVGVAISVPSFVTFAAAPNIVLDATLLFSGVGGSASCGAVPAPGQTCTLPGSALTFMNLPGGRSTASFAVSGIARDTSTGGTTPFTATYSTQFDRPFQGVLASLAGGGSVGSSYAASFRLSSGPLVGSFGIGQTSLALSSTGIDFLPLGPPNGTVVVGQFNSGTFVGLGGTQGTAKDLVFASQPVGVPISLTNFLTLAARPDISLELSLIFSGVGGSANCGAVPAPGQTCTPVGSALDLLNLAGGTSVASFVVEGIGRDAGPGQTLMDGTFTFPMTVPFQAFLAQLATGNVAGSFSASLGRTVATTAVPGPSSLLLVALGSVAGLALVRFRKRRV